MSILKSVEDQIASELLRLRIVEPTPEVVTETASASTEPVAIEPVVLAPVIEPIKVEPVVRVAETLAVPQNVKAENKPQLSNWCRTNLNIILVQNGEVAPEEIKVFSGNKILMNYPLNTVKLTEEENLFGYLNKFFLPFADELKRVTKPNSVNYLATEKDTYSFYKALAITILENASKLLPRFEVEHRVSLSGAIVTEKNNLINDIVLEFYLIYHTDYTATDLLTKLDKIQRAVVKKEIKSDTFNITSTAAFSLKAAPLEGSAWIAQGYTWEDYETTTVLPEGRDERNNILGVIKDTKRSAPHIIYSKKI